MFGLDLGKYRTIVISIALFLLFDLGVLALNFIISSEIRGDAINVNLAGRQRMLSQRSAKVALQIEDRVTGDRPYEKEMQELGLTYRLFDQTLSAFRSGGEATSGAGDAIRIGRIDDDKAQGILDQAAEIWLPYRDAINAVLAAGRANAAEAAALARKAEDANLKLLGLMNNLTTRVEDLASAKATTLRAVQVGGISLATLNFIIILFHFIRHLRTSDQEVERARRETDDILRTTQEGLFLLDPQYRMGSQHSRALAGILGRDPGPDANFIELMRTLVSPKTLDTTREYIDLLLKFDVKEKLVASLNPLDRVEAAITRTLGDVDVRYLQFRFNRVVENKQVTHLLVTVNDITRGVLLEQELQQTEARAKGQIGMLIEILRVEPIAMEQFLKATADGLQHINRQLMEQHGGPEDLAAKLNAIYRITHRLKGDAGSLGLHGLAQSLHALEDVLAGLRERGALAGEDFLPVTVQVKNLFGELELIQSALTRVAQIRGVVSVEPPRPEPDARLPGLPFVRQWTAFAAEIAARQGKQVQIAYQGMDIEELPGDTRDTLNTIVNQFIRNALVHGIEAAEARRRRGKAEAGRIAIYVADADHDGVELSFRDDGQGIDSQGIRERAIGSGRLNAEQAAGMDARALIALIFEPGFSTRAAADEDGGRGAGLDVVRDLVARLGGHIRLGTTPGEYCHFRVQIPRGTLALPTQARRESAP